VETSLSLRPRMLELGTAVSILSEHDVEDELVCHFDTPPTLQDLPTLLRMLGFDDPRAMMRTGEPVTRALSRPRRASGCSRPSRSAPSPSSGRSSSSATVIGRPPERVLKII